MVEGQEMRSIDVQVEAERRRGREARKKSAAYRLAWDMQQRLVKGVLEVISGGDPFRKRFASHHMLWLFAASHGFASQLLDQGDVEDANRWGRYIQTGSFDQGEDWFDLPGRYAIDGPTGVGKSAMANVLMAHVVNSFKAAGDRLTKGSRAVLYCCSNVDLLVACWNQLEAMGVDMAYVALVCTDEERKPEGIPSVNRADALACPVVLCTQQKVGKLSTLHHRAFGQDKTRLRSTLDDLLRFQGKDRFGLWDEAFHAADIAALNSQDLLSANSEIKIRGLVEEAVGRADVAAAADHLSSICRQMAAARSGSSRTTDALKRKGRQLNTDLVESSGYKWLGERLAVANQHGSQATIEQLAEISSAGLQVFSFPTTTGKTARVQLVQPVAKVDPLFKRVLVLDASYRVALLSASDCTIQPSRRLNCADVLSGDDRLIPKEFCNVHVTFCRGHSGRHHMEANKKNRLGMIRRQVKRILEHVPPEQKFLICTFKAPDEKDLINGRVLRNGRLITPVDWITEIQTELEAQGVPSWKQRAEFVTWGMHRGLNNWRDIRYGFAIGLLSRAWDGDLHPKAKALEGDLIDAGKTVVANAQAEGVLAEMAADMQQLIGRLYCRETFAVDGMDAGQSGETRFWVEMFEPHTRRPLQLDTSPLAKRLRDVMPGVRLSTSGNPDLDIEDEQRQLERQIAKASAAPSAEDQFKAAALRWVAGLNGAAINTNELNAGVKADDQVKPLLEAVGEKTLRRGIAAAKQQLIDEGLYVAKTSRYLVAAR